MNKSANLETSPPFDGFPDNAKDMVRIPESFFTQLLPNIETLSQIKLLLYLFWHAENQDSRIRFFQLEDLSSDSTLVKMTGGEQPLRQALSDLIQMRIVLEAKPPSIDQTYYFINGPQGRAALEAIQHGKWHENHQVSPPLHLTPDRPNIYKLYEENIGAITPMMAEILKEDEATYPKTWIEEAIRIAITRNARNWKYIQAILKRWQKEGRGYEQNRRDDSQDPDSYRESWRRHE
ncbi:MAG: DnaD domain protein [Chloroflexota bacterium]|nr:DnaD domain protein [Chloroflexota bacterium]